MTDRLTRFCVDNPELDRLNELIGEFNVFETAGLRRDEVKHSRFLSFLLSPREAHGLGEGFLRPFLQRAIQASERTDLPVSPLQCTSAVPAVPSLGTCAVPTAPARFASAVSTVLEGNRRDGESTLGSVRLMVCLPSRRLWVHLISEVRAVRSGNRRDGESTLRAFGSSCGRRPGGSSAQLGALALGENKTAADGSRGECY